MSMLIQMISHRLENQKSPLGKDLGKLRTESLLSARFMNMDPEVAVPCACTHQRDLLLMNWKSTHLLVGGLGGLGRSLVS